MSSSAEPAVSVEDVSKRYRLFHERNQSLKAALLRRRRLKYEEFWALRDVSLDIASGETFGLIGENGSGKSTLLKCMAKILRPDRGSIRVDGKVSALLELGAGFHPELSGRENVFLNGSILGLSKRELDRRFDEIVDFAGLERFIDTPVKNYSSGMYVRLGFSVAINVDPDVLLVDEVLAVGDEQFQRKCNEKFADLKAAGKTLVIVSHGLASVRNLCDRVAWLEHGVLKELGPAGDVVDAYIGVAHEDRHEEGEQGSRWGSGEGRIERIEVLDGDGRASNKVRTGDRVTFRFHYDIPGGLDRAVVGMAVHTLEGALVTGPNLREGGTVPDRLAGTGYVDLIVPRLMLLPGTYDLSVSLTDYSFLHPYDHRHRAHRFDVEMGDPRETHGGVMSMAGTWEVHEEGPDA